MATTSPDNLRTPNPGDPYNLVADLATLAGDVQSALNTRANAYTGTASQRAAFLSTATVGTLWQDTDGIGMLWKRAATAWVPAVWRWSGSTAQMNAFTQAPNGFEWFNTSDNKGYVRTSGAWMVRERGGTVTFASGTLNSISSGIFGAAVDVTIPAIAGPGEIIRLTGVGRGPSWGSISQMGTGTASGGNTVVPVRVVGFGGGASVSVTVYWEVVRV